MLPWERSSRRRAPETAELTPVLEVGRNQAGMTGLISTANGYLNESCCPARRGDGQGLQKVSERGQEDLDISNIAHRALIVVHAPEMLQRITRRERSDDLRHVSKSLESDTRPVQAPCLLRIGLGRSPGRAQIKIVLDLEQPRLESFLANVSREPGSHLADSFTYLGRPRNLNLLPCSA